MRAASGGHRLEHHTGGAHGVYHQIHGGHPLPGLSYGASGRPVRHHGAGAGSGGAPAGALPGDLLRARAQPQLYGGPGHGGLLHPSGPAGDGAGPDGERGVHRPGGLGDGPEPPGVPGGGRRQPGDGVLGHGGQGGHAAPRLPPRRGLLRGGHCRRAGPGPPGHGPRHRRSGHRRRAERRGPGGVHCGGKTLQRPDHGCDAGGEVPAGPGGGAGDALRGEPQLRHQLRLPPGADPL